MNADANGMCRSKPLVIRARCRRTAGPAIDSYRIHLDVDTDLAGLGARRGPGGSSRPGVRGGVGGEEDADRSVGEVVQLRCADWTAIPAEHGLVQWLGQDQPGELGGSERRLVGLQESSLDEILEAGSQRHQGVPGSPLVV